jgi:hypothetical protein
MEPTPAALASFVHAAIAFAARMVATRLINRVEIQRVDLTNRGQMTTSKRLSLNEDQPSRCENGKGNGHRLDELRMPLRISS